MVSQTLKKNWKKCVQFEGCADKKKAWISFQQTFVRTHDFEMQLFTAF